MALVVPSAVAQVASKVLSAQVAVDPLEVNFVPAAPIARFATALELEPTSSEPAASEATVRLFRAVDAFPLSCVWMADVTPLT